MCLLGKNPGLVKIDTEGHEKLVLEGMEKMLVRDHPLLIVETHSSELEEGLRGKGYISERLAGSPNIIFRYGGNDGHGL
jgi:hypothetical protein